MGTRSNTLVFDDGKRVINMYRHMDGYPSGHGLELAEFLLPVKLCNGLTLVDTGRMANGMGCLAAQIVAHFKDGVGAFYLESSARADNDYAYYVYGDSFEPSKGLRIVVKTGRKRLFEGTVQEFYDWCKKDGNV